jgi:hypothetical protein
MERADQPTVLGTEEISCVAVGESGQKRQTVSEGTAAGSSPVMTQERVIGSLRSSICQENTVLGEH